MPGSTARETYLSRLGPEELQNVLRHMSARPLNEHWLARLSPIDAFNILKSSSNPLTAPLCRLLEKGGICSDSSLSLWPAGPELICPTNEDIGKRIFEILPTGVGPTFERLGIDFPSSEFRDIDLLRQHCGSLRALRVTDRVQIGPFVRECRGHLRELDIAGGTLTRGSIRAIAEHCEGLVCLAIGFEFAEGSLDEIWPTVGPTVERLKLTVPLLRRRRETAHQVAPFDGVADHCTKMTEIDIGGMAHAYKESFLKLCVRLGKQVTSIGFMRFEDALEPADVAQFLALMPNAKVDLPLAREARDTIAVAGGRLTSLMVKGVVFDGIDEVAPMLKRLESAHVRISQYTVSDFMRRFFARPSVHLKKLWVESRQYDHQLDLFDVLAETVTTIEELRFNIHATFEGSYKRFADANPRLRKVSIKYKLDGLPENVVLVMNAKTEVRKIVRDFKECPKLEELEVSSRFLRRGLRDVQMLCKQIGRRGVDIYIGGEQYPSSNLGA